MQISSDIVLFHLSIHISFFITDLDKQFVTVLSLEERITWLWAIFIAFSIPEVGAFLRSVRICFFKSFNKPTFGLFLAVSQYYFEFLIHKLSCHTLITMDNVWKILSWHLSTSVRFEVCAVYNNLKHLTHTIVLYITRYNLYLLWLHDFW